MNTNDTTSQIEINKAIIQRYFADISSTKIPIGKSQDGKVSVKVIAGESLGAHAIISTKTPITYLHFTLQPSSQLVQLVPRNYNVFAYVVSGKGIFGKSGVPVERGKYDYIQK